MQVVSNLVPRRRSTINCSDPQITDQSYKNSCDINLIMAQYAKTGMLPQFRNREPRYVDNTAIPPFLEAFEVVNQAKELFYQLPSAVRKLMDNDPSQLEMFIADPANQDILLRHGVIEKVVAPDPKDKPLDVKNFEEVITKVFKPKESAKE